MKKIDLKKELKPFYSASDKIIKYVELPRLQYLTIEGKGSPDGVDFQKSLQALYPVAYTLKFKFKLEKQLDYPVMNMEALWWADDMSAFERMDYDNWKWRIMILQPDFITKNDVENAKADIRRKKGDLPFLDKVKLSAFEEGEAFQLLHIGPYNQEAENISRLHKHIDELGYKLHGIHHEIYMNDPRRNPPEKLKTIIRQPVKKK